MARGKNTKGFTLLETVVAISIIVSAILPLVGLAARSIADVQRAKNRIIAANLAQEGIELVRVVRENNKICQVKVGAWKWDRQADGSGDLGNGPGRSYLVDAVEQEGNPITCGSGPGATVFTNPQFTELAMSRGSCEDASGVEQLRLDGQNRYAYAGTTLTPFRRCVSVTNASSRDEGIIPDEMLDVVSAVSWEEKGITKKVQLKTRLYDWE